MSGRPLTYCGRISYGLYLWHLPIYLAMEAAAPEVSLAVRAPLATGASLAVAAASYRFLERPFLRLKRRYPPARRTEAETASVVTPTPDLPGVVPAPIPAPPAPSPAPHQVGGR